MLGQAVFLRLKLHAWVEIGVEQERTTIYLCTSIGYRGVKEIELIFFLELIQN